MLLEKTMGKLFTICEWIMRLAYVNLLWFLFSLAGFIILGIMPATIALFTIVRKWMMKEIDLPIWQTFRDVYRNEFKKSNRLGLCLTLGGAFIIFDLLFIQMIEGVLQIVMIVPLLLIASIYLITIIYIFPLYVHYEFNILDYLKNAFFIGVFHFHMTLLMMICISSILFLLLYQPGLIPFFSVISIAWITVYGGMYSFKKIDDRQKKISEA